MPLGEEPITSFFKPGPSQTNANKSRVRRGPRLHHSAKRARDIQDTEANSTRQKKAKPSTSSQSRVTDNQPTSSLNGNSCGGQVLLTDFLLEKRKNAFKPGSGNLTNTQRRSRSAIVDVIDLTDPTCERAERTGYPVGDSETGFTHPSCHVRSSMNADHSTDISRAPAGPSICATTNAPSQLSITPSPIVLDTHRVEVDHNINMPSRPLTPLSPPFTNDDSPAVFNDSVVMSSQSQSIDSDIGMVDLVSPSQTRFDHGMPPPLMSRDKRTPFSTPRKKTDRATNDIYSSPIVLSSQTQVIMMFDSPKRLSGSPSRTTQPSSDDDSLELVPSSQSIEEELTIPLGASQLHPRVLRRPSADMTAREWCSEMPGVKEDDHSVKYNPLATHADTTVPPLDRDYTSRQESSRANSETEAPIPSPLSAENELPKCPPLAEPSPPDSLHDTSQMTEDGEFADHSFLDDSPSPPTGQPDALSQRDSQEDMSGSMVIRDFFDIFDDEGGSLPPDFPIPLR